MQSPPPTRSPGINTKDPYHRQHQSFSSYLEALRNIGKEEFEFEFELSLFRREFPLMLESGPGLPGLVLAIACLD
ncbi:hypothetical protein SLE2022_289330 [Rubroshorea leprosula]